MRSAFTAEGGNFTEFGCDPEPSVTIATAGAIPMASDRRIIQPHPITSSSGCGAITRAGGPDVRAYTSVNGSPRIAACASAAVVMHEAPVAIRQRRFGATVPKTGT